MLSRPAETEYAAYYADYVRRGAEGDVMDNLAAQVNDLRALVGRLSEEDASRPLSEGKWSVKEVLGHLADAERVFGYRAMRFARADKEELPSFDQDAFVAGGKFNNRKIASLLDEFEHLREANLVMFRSLEADAFVRTGVASKNPVSVRALVYIIAGHVSRHIELLRERLR